MPQNDKLQQVHSYLKRNVDGFTIDYNAFEKDMEDVEKLKQVHQFLGKVNPDFKVSELEFVQDMGYKGPKKKEDFLPPPAMAESAMPAVQTQAGTQGAQVGAEDLSGGGTVQSSVQTPVGTVQGEAEVQTEAEPVTAPQTTPRIVTGMGDAVTQQRELIGQEQPDEPSVFKQAWDWIQEKRTERTTSKIAKRDRDLQSKQEFVQGKIDKGLRLLPDEKEIAENTVENGLKNMPKPKEFYGDMSWSVDRGASQADYYTKLAHEFRNLTSAQQAELAGKLAERGDFNEFIKEDPNWHEKLGELVGSQIPAMVYGVITGPYAPLTAGGMQGAQAQTQSFTNYYQKAKDLGLSDEEATKKAALLGQVSKEHAWVEGAIGTLNPFGKAGGKIIGKAISNSLDVGVDAGAAAAMQMIENDLAKAEDMPNELWDEVAENAGGEAIFSILMKLTGVPGGIYSRVKKKAFASNPNLTDEQKAQIDAVERGEEAPPEETGGLGPITIDTELKQQTDAKEPTQQIDEAGREEGVEGETPGEVRLRDAEQDRPVEEQGDQAVAEEEVLEEAAPEEGPGETILDTVSGERVPYKTARTHAFSTARLSIDQNKTLSEQEKISATKMLTAAERAELPLADAIKKVEEKFETTISPGARFGLPVIGFERSQTGEGGVTETAPEVTEEAPAPKETAIATKIPIESTDALPGPVTDAINAKVKELTDAGDTEATKTINEAVANSIKDEVNNFATENNLDLEVTNVRTGEGVFTDTDGNTKTTPNFILSTKGDPEHIQMLMERSAQALGQRAGNSFREPTEAEKQTRDDLDDVFIIRKSDENITPLYEELSQLKDSDGNQLFGGLSTLDDGWMIHGKFKDSDFLQEVVNKGDEIEAIFRKYKDASFKTDKHEIKTYEFQERESTEELREDEEVQRVDQQGKQIGDALQSRLNENFLNTVGKLKPKAAQEVKAEKPSKPKVTKPKEKSAPEAERPPPKKKTETKAKPKAEKKTEPKAEKKTEKKAKKKTKKEIAAEEAKAKADETHDKVISLWEEYQSRTKSKRDAATKNKIKVMAREAGFQIIDRAEGLLDLKQWSKLKKKWIKPKKTGRTTETATTIVEGAKALTDYSKEFQQDVNDVLDAALQQADKLNILTIPGSNTQRPRLRSIIGNIKEGKTTRQATDLLEALNDAYENDAVITTTGSGKKQEFSKAKPWRDWVAENSPRVTMEQELSDAEVLKAMNDDLDLVFVMADHTNEDGSIDWEKISKGVEEFDAWVTGLNSNQSETIIDYAKRQVEKERSRRAKEADAGKEESAGKDVPKTKQRGKASESREKGRRDQIKKEKEAPAKKEPPKKKPQDDKLIELEKDLKDAMSEIESLEIEIENKQEEITSLKNDIKNIKQDDDVKKILAKIEKKKADLKKTKNEDKKFDIREEIEALNDEIKEAKEDLKDQIADIKDREIGDLKDYIRDAKREVKNIQKKIDKQQQQGQAVKREPAKQEKKKAPPKKSPEPPEPQGPQGFQPKSDQGQAASPILGLPGTKDKADVKAGERISPKGIERVDKEGRRIKPKKLNEIINDLYKNLNQFRKVIGSIKYAKVPIKGRKGIAASFDPLRRLISLKRFNNLDDLAHELSHGMDKTFDLYKGIAEADYETIVNELTPFSKHGSPAPWGADAHRYEMQEGIAEWVRAYIVNPEEAKENAPVFYKHYRKSLSDEAHKLIDDYSKDLRLLFGHSTHEVIESSIANNRPKTMTENIRATWNELLENLQPHTRNPNDYKLSYGDRFAQKWLDTLRPYESTVKFAALQGGADLDQLLPKDNPLIMARLFSGVNERIENQIERGLMEHESLTRVRDAATGDFINLSWLLEPFNNESGDALNDEIREMITYGVARRNLEMPLKFVERQINESLENGEIIPAEVINSNERFVRKFKERNDKLRELTYEKNKQWKEKIRDKGAEKKDKLAEKTEERGKKLEDAKNKKLDKVRAKRQDLKNDREKLGEKKYHSELKKLDVQAKVINQVFKKDVTRELRKQRLEAARIDRAADNAMKQVDKSIKFAVIKNPSPTKAWTGIGGGLEAELTTAQRRVEEVEKRYSEGKRKRLQEGLRRYQVWADQLLKNMVASGRISADSYKAIKDTNEEYIALNRVMEAKVGEDIEFAVHKSGKGLATVSQPLKRLEGSSRMIENPYKSLIENTYKTIKETDRNTIARTFVDFMEKMVRANTDQAARVSKIISPATRKDDTTISVFRDGKEEFYKLDQDLYNSMKGITEVAQEGKTDFFMKMAATMRASVTLNPVFAARNMVRDLQTMFVLSENVRGVQDVLPRKREDIEDVTQADAFSLMGGGQGGYHLLSKDFYYKALDENIRKLSNDKGSVVMQGQEFARLAGKTMQSLSERSEKVTRMKEFRNSFARYKKKGYDDYNAGLQAAYDARSLMDFAIAGEWAARINKYIPFTNAKIQGLRITAKKARKNPALFAAKAFMSVMLPQMMLRMMYSDEDEERYRQLPAYQRNQFWNIPIGDRWLTIPKPHDVAILATSGDLLYDRMHGYDTEEGYGELWGMIQQMLPLSKTDVAGPLRSVTEAALNRDTFRDRNLVSPYETGKDLELRNYALASNLGKFIGENANIDPRKIDHIIRGQFTYFGTQAMAASDFGRKDKSPSLLNLSGFFKSENPAVYKDVQWLQEQAALYGLEREPYYDFLREMVYAYYNAETPEAKKTIAKEVRNFSGDIKRVWKAHGIKDRQAIENEIGFEVGTAKELIPEMKKAIENTKDPIVKKALNKAQKDLEKIRSKVKVFRENQ